MATKVKSTNTELTVDEFLLSYIGKPKTKYELEDGHIIKMAAETVRHALIKSNIGYAIKAAIAKAKLPCKTFVDGVSIKVDQKTSRIPDVVVQCGGKLEFDGKLLDSPIIVVEVVSPSSDYRDSHVKFIEYFSLASISHYLTIAPQERLVLNHQRSVGDKILTKIIRDGKIDFLPPGFSISHDSIFEGVSI